VTGTELPDIVGNLGRPRRIAVVGAPNDPRRPAEVGS